jgi:transketolase
VNTDSATLPELAVRIRTQALRAIHIGKGSHVGTCLSMADLLAVLYGKVLRVQPARPDWVDRDRFILSKGQGAAALYAVLSERGFFPEQWLETYCHDDSLLTGHASHHVPGVEISTGALGHGLPIGCGMALAATREDKSYRVFVLMSDGECDEGSVWEAALFAPHHRLDNLIAIIDYNKIQSYGSVREVLNLEPLAEKWRAFGWAVREIDGHAHAEIAKALSAVPFEPGKPSLVLAHTVKGKGVSFMEHQLAWHYKSPSREELALALHEIEPEA